MQGFFMQCGRALLGQGQYVKEGIEAHIQEHIDAGEHPECVADARQWLDTHVITDGMVIHTA